MGVKGDFFFFKIEDIIASLYSVGNSLVESRDVKINDAGARARGQLQGEKSLSCGSSIR